MPPSPLRGEGYAALRGTLKHRWRSPHPPQCAHWGTFSQEKAFHQHTNTQMEDDNMEMRFPLILDGATGTQLQKRGYQAT